MAPERSVERRSTRMSSKRMSSKDMVPAWCSISSVLKLEVRSPTSPPFRPPVDQYLREVLLACRFGIGDRSDVWTEEREQSAIRLVCMTTLVDKVQACADACGVLFWVCIGLIFGNMAEGALEAFRSHFARSWYMICLETREICHSDPAARDWMMMAWPVIFAQASFRMMVDAFKEDKDNFVSSSESLLEKLTQICHYETTGFQMDRGTSMGLRKKMFLRRVLRNPEQNQVEFLAAAERQDVMERAKEEMGNIPMSFARSPEEGAMVGKEQLLDLWENRTEGTNTTRDRWGKGALRNLSDINDEQGKKTNKKMSTLADAVEDNLFSPCSIVNKLQRAWSPNEEMAAGRYEKLGVTGDQLFLRQCLEVQEALGEQEEPESEEEEEEPEPESPWSPLSPMPWAHGRSSAPELSRTWPGPSGPQRRTPMISKARSHLDPQAYDERPRGSCEADPDATPLASTSPSRLNRWRKAKAIGPVTALLGSKERKERREREKAVRQREVALRIGKDQLLPRDFCSKELCTTWVSPAVKGLCADAEDKCILKKPAAEGFKLKMQVDSHLFSRPGSRTAGEKKAEDRFSSNGSRPGSRASASKMAKSSVTKSASDSELRRPSKLNTSPPSILSIAAARSTGAANISGANSPCARSNLFTPTRKDHRFLTEGCEATMLPRMNTSKEWSSFSSQRGFATASSVPTGGELLAMEENPSVAKSTWRLEGQSRDLGRRLDLTSKAVQKSSFSEYMKEYNILTGEPKIRIDWQNVCQEEEACLRSSQDILKSRAKRICDIKKIRIVSQLGMRGQ